VAVGEEAAQPKSRNLKKAANPPRRNPAVLKNPRAKNPRRSHNLSKSF
jgi:hypothetical protein